MLAATAARYPHAPAQRVWAETGWDTTTYAQLHQHVRELAAALIHGGFAAGERLCLFAPNRPEWTWIDFATISAGGIVVPIFSTSTPDQAGHIIRDSGATVVVCETQREVQIIRDGIAHLADPPRILSIDDVEGVRSIASLEHTADDLDELDRRLAAATLDDPCTIIYTSGTTGDPRGAVHAHRAFTHQIDCIATLYQLAPGDSSVAFLPLAHALERIWTYFVLSQGALDVYCRSPRQIGELLTRARPTCLISVPKLYERVYSTAYEKASASPTKKHIFDWAISVGARCQAAYEAGHKPRLAMRLRLHIADALVLSSIRDAVGGPKKVLISGGAPLRDEIQRFFSAIGLLLGQGYGLTETGPMATFFSPSTFKYGTVGYPIWGTEMRVADDGELLFRGPNLMLGYWNNPEATAQAIDADGWFHTGDVGIIDDDGHVIVTDRKKDIIVTSGGKNVAPQPIEGLLTSDPAIEYAVVLGDNRPYLTLLVEPSVKAVEEIGRQLQLQWANVEELFEHPEIAAEMLRRVQHSTAKLASFEQIRDLRIIRGLTNEEGLLTPTLKVKRKAVETKFSDLVEDMYAKVRPRKEKKS